MGIHDRGQEALTEVARGGRNVQGKVRRVLVGGGRKRKEKRIRIRGGGAGGALTGSVDTQVSPQVGGDHGREEREKVMISLLILIHLFIIIYTYSSIPLSTVIHVYSSVLIYLLFLKFLHPRRWPSG